MNTTNYRQKARPERGHKMTLCVVLLWILFAVPAQALLVTVDLGWGYGGGHNLSEYNLQQGSIVQVIMYEETIDVLPPGPGASDNFVADSYGTYGGAGIPAQPNPPGAIPTDLSVYNPYATPEGHTIAYTTQIGAAVDGWWQIYAQFEILGTYDRLYIRVFGATDFPSGNVWASYWGISAVAEGTNIIDTWYVDPIVNVVASNANYFEVIPEPTSMALFLLGGAGLWTRVHRRKKAG